MCFPNDIFCSADKEHLCVRKLPSLLLATTANHAKKEIIKESAYFLLHEVTSG